MVGQVVRYVAAVDDEWAAILGWVSTVLEVTVRNAWIGWSDAQRHRRLRYVANKVRYCTLSGWSVPNLAPRVERYFRPERTTTKLASEPLRHKRAYGVTNCLPEEAPPDDLLHSVQGHWGIENKAPYSCVLRYFQPAELPRPLMLSDT